MFEIKGIRTFAMSAKNIDKAVEFYTKIDRRQDSQNRRADRRATQSRPSERSRRPPRQLRSAYLRRVERPARRRSAPYPEYSMAGKRPGAQDAARLGRHGGKDPAPPRHRQLLDQRLRSRRQPLGTIFRERELGKISRKERKRRIEDVGATGRSPSNRLRKTLRGARKLRDHAIAAPPPQGVFNTPLHRNPNFVPFAFFAAKSS